ncbi:PKD domain-containing protein [Taibaiella soli]|uniref:PKD domain-containing protein n=1 Tax=Taibaiella soli TaxID=1649169 RepID=A0A2W2B451_9BACT|nr:PKD domain-containing protein [Taibaiella soli]PZF71029.1 hypothetical protein DN068_20210 [Taibaiella soli]
MKKILTFFAALLTIYSADAQCSAGFSATQTPVSASLQNVNFLTGATWNTPLPTGNAAFLTMVFGDGSANYTSQGNYTTNHIYATPGTYYAKLAISVIDTIHGLLVCTDTADKQVTVTGPATPCQSIFSTAIDASNNGDVQFVASNPSGTQNMHYSWIYGDGYTGTGANVTHNYTSTGTYTVTLTAIDSASNPACVYTVSNVIQVINTCGGHIANYNVVSISYSTANINNTSATFQGQSLETHWDFGDGATSNATFAVTHAYAAAGTYNVKMTVKWIDINSLNIICMDSTTNPVTVLAPQNIISGNVVFDSLGTPLGNIDTAQVWLYKKDASGLYQAVDSQKNNLNNYVAYYGFQNQPSGTYIVRAKRTTGAQTGMDDAPTYYSASLYWSQATDIVHTGVTITGKDIIMQSGTMTLGPGTISGTVADVNGNGVANILVLLRDINNQLMKYTYTDANGNYSFGTLFVGVYSVYPELLNYVTTPISNVMITSSSNSQTGLVFTQTTNEIKPKETGVAGVVKNNFVVYPNPAKNMTFIRWEQTGGAADITVTDVAGRVVKELKNIPMTGTTELNVAALQSGLYFVKIQTGTTQQTVKISIL